MSTELLAALTVFVLAILCGFAVISKVPATLHTPLMSGANSIHGIVLVGAMLIAAEAKGGVSQAMRTSDSSRSTVRPWARRASAGTSGASGR